MSEHHYDFPLPEPDEPTPRLARVKIAIALLIGLFVCIGAWTDRISPYVGFGLIGLSVMLLVDTYFDVFPPRD